MERRINSEEVRRLYESGWPVRRIAKHLGFTYSGIRIRLVRNGVKIRGNRAVKFDVAVLRKLYVKQKMSAAETRRAMGASHATFYRLVRQSGIPLRSRPKLDPDEVRRLYAERGWSMKQIGKHLGVDGRTVKHRLLKDGVPFRGQHHYKYDPAKTRELYAGRKMSMAETAAALGANRSTVWRQLKREGVRFHGAKSTETPAPAGLLCPE